MARRALAGQRTHTGCRVAIASPNPVALLARETGESGCATGMKIGAPRTSRRAEASSAILGKIGSPVAAAAAIGEKNLKKESKTAPAVLRLEEKTVAPSVLKREDKSSMGISPAAEKGRGAAVVKLKLDEGLHPPLVGACGGSGGNGPLKLAEKGSGEVAPAVLKQKKGSSGSYIVFKQEEGSSNSTPPFVGANGGALVAGPAGPGGGGGRRGGGGPGGGGRRGGGGGPGSGGGGGGPGPAGGGGGGGGGGPGPGGGGGGGGHPGGDRRRLPYASCESDEGCNVDAVLYCPTCYTIFCQDHVCECTAHPLTILPMPNISAADLELHQHFPFPHTPWIFVGAYREGTEITYHFCRLTDVFSTAPFVIVQSFHLDIHGVWIARARRKMGMMNRALFFPQPQFLFINV